MQMEYSVIKFHKHRKIAGFTVQPGFLAVVNNHGKIYGFTSGFCSGSSLGGECPQKYNNTVYIYTYKNNRWIAHWEDDWREYNHNRYDYRNYIPHPSEPIKLLANYALDRDDCYMDRWYDRNKKEEDKKDIEDDVHFELGYTQNNQHDLNDNLEILDKIFRESPFRL